MGHTGPISFQQLTSYAVYGHAYVGVQADIVGEPTVKVKST